MAITSYKAVVGYYNGAGTPNITTAVTGQLSDGWVPIGSPILTDAYGQCTQMMAKTDATPFIATSAYTVVTAANPQPPDATWDAQGEPLWIDTATYLQAYTKGGSYPGVLPVAKGGTGATTTLAAAANLQVFSISNNLSEIVNSTAAWLNVRPIGPLPLAGDPTGPLDATTKQWVESLRSVADTWSVINGDTTLPGNNTEIHGGAIRSVYQVADADHMSVEVRAQGTVGGVYTPVIEMVSPSGGVPVTRTWPLPQVASELVGRDSIGTSGAKIPLLSTTNTWDNSQTINGSFFVNGDLGVFSKDGGNVHDSTGPTIYATNTGGTATLNGVNNGGLFSSEVRNQTAFFGCREFVGTSTNGVIAVRFGSNWSNFFFRNNGNAYAESGSWVNSSDERFKDNITRIADPLHVVASLRGCSWVRKDSGDNGIGLIAQDVERVLPDAIKMGNPDMTLPDKTVIKDPLAIDTGAIGAAVSIEAIKALMSVMKDAISTVASTTSDEMAKATLLALANKIPDVS